jgi:hypothetical protein
MPAIIAVVTIVLDISCFLLCGDLVDLPNLSSVQACKYKRGARDYARSVYKAAAACCGAGSLLGMLGAGIVASPREWRNWQTRWI